MTATTASTGSATGLLPAVRSAIVWTLTDLGFPRHDAEAWADAWSMKPDLALVAHQAVAYDDHGIPLAQALDWHHRGFIAYEATCLYDARWTPVQAATARELAWNTGTELDDWLRTGLPADRGIAYLRANVDIDKIDDFEAAPGGPGALVEMLAGLLG